MSDLNLIWIVSTITYLYSMEASLFWVMYLLKVLLLKINLICGGEELATIWIPQLQALYGVDCFKSSFLFISKY